MNIQSCTT